MHSYENFTPSYTEEYARLAISFICLEVGKYKEEKLIANKVLSNIGLMLA
jgi:hypothetical protein